jgi:hypothetical protein
MHGLNKTDDYHDVIESKPDAYAALPDQPGDSEDETRDAETPPHATIPEAEQIGDVDDDQEGDDEAECPNCGEPTDMTEEEAAEFLQSNTVTLPDGQTVNGAFCTGCGNLIRYAGEA